ncbi:MAG: proline dehydrogenase family protein [Planctomycetota bacterium]|nr:proline dehydrogenase family protein [Planctomycetota bacterium]
MEESYQKKVHSLLFEQQDKDLAPENQQQRAVEVARLIQSRATELQTPQEREQQQELDQLIQNPADKATVTSITDQAFRPHSPRRSMDQFIHILDVQGIPRFFSRIDRALLQGIRSFGSYLPGVATPLIREKMQRETANVILPADDEHLTAHLSERQQAGLRMNVNLLGEMVLGEQEAADRIEKYLSLLSLDEIEVLSVKISNLYSQITSIASSECIPILCERLDHLIQMANQQRFRQANGELISKMVYLDMEEYRDMEITAQVFMKTLDRPDLISSRAGIALQAYLPDAYRVQQRLTHWALKRVKHGGSPITIRIVKGANMEMERVEASIAGFPQAPFKAKINTDANYKRMLQFGIKSENLQAVHIGVASHNLLDISYALVRTADEDAFDCVQFEMLEGMANHQRRALHEIASNLLLYAPACKQTDFLNAIGYLIRRLDENTGPDNFLRHAFQIETGSPEWQHLEKQFIESFSQIPNISSRSRRESVGEDEPPSHVKPSSWREFKGQPNTDFTQPAGNILCEKALRIAEQLTETGPIHVTPVLCGTSVDQNTTFIDREDPSHPETIAVRLHLTDAHQIGRAVTCAEEDGERWNSVPAEERFRILEQVAKRIDSHRSELMAISLIETGKTLYESDPEVSEAVDFIRFYSLVAKDFSSLEGTQATPTGPVVVLSPWNFPIAIPCGGIAAALAAGNTVILKPAPSASATAARLCQYFWDSGISRSTLQLLPCLGREAGDHLINRPEIQSVVLTGATITAQRILKRNPGLKLFAETGGKNATIITAMADRELAIKHVIESSFGHSGQKCSATSLLILEAEVYDDPHFKNALVDAAASLPVGSAWKRATRIGPLIDPPSEALSKGLKTLDPFEHWALAPQIDSKNPRQISPGIKWGVRSGSFSHQTEFFGPLLSVLRADSLPHAIEIANQTPYGLTSGLESLDDREQATWKDQIQAGNLYINRSTTGAIVLRQPFGGIRKSSFGPGIKAGGPHYVKLFTRFENRKFETSFQPTEELKPIYESLCREINHWQLTPDALQQIASAMASYELFFHQEFNSIHDHFKLIGQDNLRSYQPLTRIALCIGPDDPVEDIILRIAATVLTGNPPQFFLMPGIDKSAESMLCQSDLYQLIRGRAASDDEKMFIDKIREGQVGRLRASATTKLPPLVTEAAHEAGVAIIDTPVSFNGMVELPWYFQEKSLSANYHRYGNLGTRSDELRSEPR